jgi:hypothetical protein
MVGDITLSGARWLVVKWWACNEREDLTARAALSVDSLRAAGFLARIGERVDDSRREPYTALLRVEVFGTDEVHIRARHHLRGLWAALGSRGMPKDYRIGFSTGVALMTKREKAIQLPAVSQKKLKALVRHD